MNTINDSLKNWLNALNNFSFQSYEQLPDLDLYMDQVIQFLDKELFIFQTSSDDKQITPSMINNYVKGEVLPAPIKKKYNREHLALIDEIATLKQVLSIAEVKQIIDSRYDNSKTNSEVFKEFNDLNNKNIDLAVTEAFKELNDIDENDYKSLTLLATKFAITANTYINIAKRILYLVRNYQYKEKSEQEYLEKLEAEKQKKEKKAQKKTSDDSIQEDITDQGDSE